MLTMREYAIKRTLFLIRVPKNVLFEKFRALKIAVICKQNFKRLVNHEESGLFKVTNLQLITVDLRFFVSMIEGLT